MHLCQRLITKMKNLRIIREGKKKKKKIRLVTNHPIKKSA